MKNFTVVLPKPSPHLPKINLAFFQNRSHLLSKPHPHEKQHSNVRGVHRGSY